MTSQDLNVTIDQWEQDDQGDYGIINITAPDGTTYGPEVFNEDDSVADMVKFLTGMDVIKVTRHPFNPFGDGTEYTVKTKEA